MKNLSNKLLLVIAGLFLSTFTQVVIAQVYTDRSLIYVLDSGWAADSLSVQLVSDTPTGSTNPAGCSIPNAGYVTSPTDPGRKLYQDQLVAAFLQNLPVKLLIHNSNCVFNKPRIISVQQCRPNTTQGLTC